MTIIERLQQHKDLQPYKIALIVDEEQYTYGQLYDAIISMEFNNTSRIINLGQFNDGQKNKVLLTQSLSFVEQLLQWLWGLYKGYIPMVCHNEMDVAYIDELARIISVEGVPTSADFGVLTSGTTGRPKPLWRSESSWREFFDIQNNIFYINKDTKIFLHGSFSFTGVSNMVVAVLWSGGTVITTSSLRPIRWIQLIDKYHVDHIYALPTKLRLLVRHCKSKLDSISYIIGGSQVLDRQLMEQLELICPNMEFILYYGASELNYITYCTGKEWLDREGTVGRPFPSVIIAEQNGVIYVTTKHHIEGIPDTYTVNDCGYIDSDGYLMFHGRRGDVINKGGYKISIPEMELYLQSLQGVSEVAVITINDEIRGEDFIAYMVLEDNTELSKIIECIHHERPSVEWPKAILEIPMIPLTECSKVDKRKLKEWYNKG
ncbi:MAG: AMP-binding protein [Veillonella sp.]|jgi:putative AMP-binding enzyme domain protein|uniref:AMP-binding protein n=1 Tax=Veillonella sp. TaxID=1926307 RepID=UPI001CB62228|nr:AMP-binding protein [Veillonella sp.]MBF1759892.1 AMP-binding protein [Veillonella sp.]MDU2711204.1 AMP-binding protein [Veillonella sp.]MDU4573577.1 AMP-binding protein [Veillonella sp.]